MSGEVGALGGVLLRRQGRQSVTGPTLPCGCGLDAPIISPLFSNTCTQRYRRPSSMTCSTQASTTWRIAGTGISARVRSCRGEKQITRQVPRSPHALSKGCGAISPIGVSGSSAGKSLVKTNVPS
jgi:hypothetical protein